MKKVELKKKLYSILFLIFGVVVISWVAFYLRTSAEITQTNQKYVSQVSDRIIDTMEGTFLGLEHVAVALSVSEQVKEFVLEEEPIIYHQKAGEVKEILEAIYQPDGLVDDILIYDMDGVYRRFRGELGNTAANRIHYLVNPNQMPQHIAVQLEGISYIGYITGIYQDRVKIGYLVFLMQSSRLESLFQSYDTTGTLQIGLVADDMLVAANKGDYLNQSVTEFRQDATYSIRQVGLTPFQVLVADDGETLRQSRRSFLYATSVTIMLLLMLMLLFYRLLHKLFFRPMLGLMENARQISAGSGQDRLKPTGEEEFDRLVYQINSMISRLEENSRTLFEMQYKMQNAEIEKQRAIIISLKKQINAHFTVNTLNVIKRLNEMGENHKAAEMCNGLSYLLRYANGGEEYIGGLEEMFVLEKYVDIMRIRYPERFVAVFDVDDRMDDVMLPRMLVQPIVENAISHGLAFAKQGRLHISATVGERNLIIRIEDNGCGIGGEKLTDLRKKIAEAPRQPWVAAGIEHIALLNIQKRVVSQFGEEYGLTIDSTVDQGTVAQLTLPVRTAKI